MYIWGFFDRIQFCLVISLLAFLINGSYVIYSIMEQPYDGREPALAIWAAVLVYANLFMSPLPVSVFYSALIPSIGNPFPYSVQQSLPYALCLHLAKLSLDGFLRFYPRLKKKREK